MGLADAEREPRAGHERHEREPEASDEHRDMIPDQADPGRRDRPKPGSRVTVVIPNWNGRRWLPGCLASLREQQLGPVQTIVVDNGSTDGSVEYLRAEHPQVELI